jgi:cysteine-rich repeat protein
MTMRSGRTIGWAGLGLGLALLAGCSADPETIEDSTTSSDELRRGGHSGPAKARRGHGRPGHDHGHRHGPRCGHGHGKGHGHGGHGKGGSPGAGGSGGTNSAGGGGMSQGGGAGAGTGSGASSTGGTAGTSSGGSGGFAGSGGTAGTPGTGGSFGGVGGGGDPGVCGDGVWSYFEQCDDANSASGDGCDDACQIEPGYTCNGAECREVLCGDSLQDVYAIGGGIFEFEECDDGNDEGDDGCSSTCDVETGFVCVEPGVPCREVVCGDGFQDSYFIPGEGGTGGSGTTGGTGGSMGGFAGSGGSAGAGGGGTFVFESCDDGNVSPGDGCSATCVIEDGFICDRPGVPCREPSCGDGFIDFIPGDGTGGTGGTGGTSSTGGTGGFAGSGMGGGGTFEQCDDGNETSTDGCSASCTIEPGFACYEPATPCHRIVCGDGLADWPDEECDDGNSIPDDGCTNCTFDGGGGSGGFGGGFGGTFGMGGGSTTGGSGGVGGSG